MKKNGFWAGVLATLAIIVMISGISAKNGTMTQTVQYNNIGVILNGERLKLVDANGNSVEPFMYNNTNYLPVRAIAEALGLDVSFDNNQNAIVLTLPENQENQKDEEIEELLFAKESIRFYYTGYVQTDEGYEINLKIENDSDYRITGRIGPDAVAGSEKVYMELSCKTAPGRTSEGKIKISNEELEKAGIEDFKTVRVSFMIRSDQNPPYDLEFGTGFITIRIKK